MQEHDDGEGGEDVATMREIFLIDRVLSGLKNPSWENLSTFFTICLLLAVISAVLVTFCTEKFDMNDSKSAGPLSKLDIDGLYKDVDQAGPFTKTETGEISPENFVTLKRIIGKHVNQCFRDEGIKLQDDRIPDLKEGELEAYKEKVISSLQ